MVEVIYHLFDGKIFADELLSTTTEPFAQRRVVGELEQALGNGGSVAGANQKAGFAIKTNLVRAVEIVGNDRFARRQRLGQGTRERFAG